MSQPISLPKGYKRLESFPIDSDSIFSSLSDMIAYVEGPTSYIGHVISCTVDNVTKVYVVIAGSPNNSYLEIGTSGSGIAVIDPPIWGGDANGDLNLLILPETSQVLGGSSTNP